MVAYEILNLAFQIVYFYRNRVSENRETIVYDKYVWKKHDNLTEAEASIDEFDIDDMPLPPVELEQFDEPCLDMKNTFGLCISKKTVQKLKTGISIQQPRMKKFLVADHTAYNP